MTERRVAEDVYYVARDGGAVIGLNQLMGVPRQLTEVELQAIETMCDRSCHTMRCWQTATPIPPSRDTASLEDLPHGLYYVGPTGLVWLISNQGARPDLAGTEMDFAIATLLAGVRNLSRLRQEQSS